MKEYTDEDISHIKEIISADNKEQALEEVEEMHPADIAELYSNLDLNDFDYLFKLLDERTGRCAHGARRGRPS